MRYVRHIHKHVCNRRHFYDMGTAVLVIESILRQASLLELLAGLGVVMITIIDLCHAVGTALAEARYDEPIEEDEEEAA